MPVCSLYILKTDVLTIALYIEVVLAWKQGDNKVDLARIMGVYSHMLLKEILTVYESLDSPHANAKDLSQLFIENRDTEILYKTIKGERGETDFIKIKICGRKGKSNNGNAPTIGILGRLGGVGTRPNKIGFVSDGDGAVAALAAALKLNKMQKHGDVLEGDVIICTHICPDAPVQEHKPVSFMGSPIDMEMMNKLEVDSEMDAILSIDTTKGNRIINRRGIAISPTIMQGYILPVSDDLLDILSDTSGVLPQVLPAVLQDITPYGNGLHHINSIFQPAVATESPVVGVAITTETTISGSATGASHANDVELAARFSVEVAKQFTLGECRFFDAEEFVRLIELYGSLIHFQK